MFIIISNNIFTSQDSKGNFAVNVKDASHNQAKSDSSFVLIHDDLDVEIVKFGTDLGSIPNLEIFSQSKGKESSPGNLDKEVKEKAKEELSFSCCSNLVSYLTSLVTSLTESFTYDIHKKD